MLYFLTVLAKLPHWLQKGFWCLTYVGHVESLEVKIHICEQPNERVRMHEILIEGKVNEMITFNVSSQSDLCIKLINILYVWVSYILIQWLRSSPVVVACLLSLQHGLIFVNEENGSRGDFKYAQLLENSRCSHWFRNFVRTFNVEIMSSTAH